MGSSRIVTLCCIGLLSLLLTGCWDRREINDVAFVSADAIDFVNGKYQVSIQLPLPGQLGGIGSAGGGGGTGGNKPWYNDSQTGQAGGEINDRLQLKLSRQINYSHRRVVIFGEAVSKKGLSRILDILARIPQNRMTAQILVSEGPARELLNTDGDVERFPSEMIRELSVASMRRPRTLKNLVDVLLTDGIDPSLPLIQMAQSQPGDMGKPKNIVKLAGLAVFQNDRLAGYLQNEQAVGAVIAMKDAKNPAIVVPAENGSGVLSLRVQKYHTKLLPSYDGANLTMNMDIKIQGSLQENESNYDETPLGHIEKLQQIAANKVKQMVESAVNQLQNEYGSDPIGFGDAFHRKYPKLWHKIGPIWRETYPKVQVAVKCSVHIEQTGSLLKPFGVKEVQK